MGGARPAPPAEEVRRFFGPHNAGGEPRAAAQDPTAIVLPPHFYPPPNAVGFNPFGTATVAGPASWATPAGALHTVSGPDVAIVRSLGMAVRNLLATTDVSIVLRAGGAPLQPVRRIPAQPAAFIRETWDSIAYIIPGGTQIDCLVTVADGGTYSITGYYEGWTIPRVEWDRIWGEQQ